MPQANHSKRTTSFREKSVSILLGLILALIVLELFLRLGASINEFVQELRNQQSLQRKGSYVILCVGESTTRGQYPRFLEEILNREGAGIRFSVIDKGVVGTNSSAILDAMPGYIAACNPHMVVSMMGCNDYQVLFYKDAPAARSFLFKHCRAYRLIQLIYFNFSRKLQESFFVGHVRPEHNSIYYCNLGKDYIIQGKLTEAERSLNKAIELDPRNDDAYAKLGRLYHIQGKLVQSECALNKAIELDCRNDSAYYALGLLNRAQGKLAESEAACKKALLLNPQGNAITALGALYFIQGNLPLAEAASREAIKLHPRNDTGYILLGGLYLAQGKLYRAEGIFVQAMALNIESDRLYGFGSVMYRRLGKLKLAEEYAQKANNLRLRGQSSITTKNYNRLRQMLDKRGIRLVCVQYPMSNLEPLKKMFEGQGKGVIFVDNEQVFKDAVKINGFASYFSDMFGGEFGHCTFKGNALLAENIARVILNKVFHVSRNKAKQH